MIYIAGIGVLEPDKKLRRFLRRQRQVKDFIADFIRHTSAFDMYARTKKLLDVTHRSIPKNLPINSIFWPVGANRFGVGVFLVTEKVASYVFAVSGMQSRTTIMYDRVSTEVAGFTSHCLAQMAPSGTNTTNIAVGNTNPIANDISTAVAAMTGQLYAFNLMPVPVLVTQRSRHFIPMRYQSYFATWMIPVMYIPIVESDNIKIREEYISGRSDGFGVLIMVDQRYLWNFIYIPQGLIAQAEMNNCYFHWYRLLNTLRAFLMPQQTSSEALAPYGRMFFVDTIDPEFQSEDDPCRMQDGDPNKRAFDDDRAYWGPPIDIWSEGVDFTLSEMFALIEQSLNKRMLFHPNWQIEFVNSVLGRKRMIRNLLLFVPRIVYKNDSLFEELEVTPQETEKWFIAEKVLESGGLVRNFPTNFIEIDEQTGSILMKTEKAFNVPEPRYPITLPHVIEVVGNLYLTPKDDIQKPSPSADAAVFYPLQYVYYQCCLVPKDQAIVSNPDLYDWLEDGDLYHFSYDPVGNQTKYECYPYIFLPGTLMGTQGRAMYDVSKMRILTSHLCVVKTNADNSKKETKDDSPSHLNRKPSWRLGRAIVRDMLGWLLFPFTWHFQHANYWPLTGYEDYLIIRSNGSVYVKGQHAKMISRKTGIKYVGWQSPTAVANVVDEHPLLDNHVHHVDGSEQSPVKGAVVGSYPNGSTIDVPGVKLNGEPMKTKATVWSAIIPPE